MEVVVVLAALGVVAAMVAVLVWPAMTKADRHDPERQGAVTDRDVIPPRRPDTPIPGSQPDRERKGRP